MATNDRNNVGLSEFKGTDLVHLSNLVGKNWDILVVGFDEYFSPGYEKRVNVNLEPQQIALRAISDLKKYSMAKGKTVLLSEIKSILSINGDVQDFYPSSSTPGFTMETIKPKKIERDVEEPPQKTPNQQEQQPVLLEGDIKAWELLNIRVDQKKLSDLHTHLMGMGDADFWYDQAVHYSKKCDQIEVWGNDVTHININKSKKPISIFEKHRTFEQWARQQLKQPTLPSIVDGKAIELWKANQHAIFAYGVILPTDGLIALFSKATESKEETKEHENGRIAGLLDVKEVLPISDYIIWNARNQQLQFRRGLPLEYLIEKAEKSDRIKSLIRNCFELLDDEGKPMKETTIHNDVRCRFTPEFCPKRYEFKDYLYERNPSLLSTLMSHVIQRYHDNGVSYVELSVSVKDLTHPWMYQHLVEALQKSNSGVEVYFLAAFSRNAKDKTKRNPERNGQNEKWLALLRQIAQNNLPGEYVIFHLSQLELLKHRLKEIKETPSNTEVDGYSLRKRLVGLDYVGDEKYHSTCSFIHQDFIDFAKERKADGQTRFGFRVHGGENIFIDTMQRAIVDGLYPMAVVSAGLLKLMERLEEELEADFDNPHLRVGHGIEFVRYRPNESRQKEEKTIWDVLKLNDNLDSLMLDTIARKLIIECFYQLQSKRVYFEICPTSNFDLLVSDLRPLRELCYHMRLVICTDNDGIFTIQYKAGTRTYGSVAAELAKAISDVDSKVDQEKLDDLIDNAREGGFSTSSPNSNVFFPDRPAELD